MKIMITDLIEEPEYEADAIRKSVLFTDDNNVVIMDVWWRGDELVIRTVNGRLAISPEAANQIAVRADRSACDEP